MYNAVDFIADSDYIVLDELFWIKNKTNHSFINRCILCHIDLYIYKIHFYNV